MKGQGPYGQISKHNMLSLNRTIQNNLKRKILPCFNRMYVHNKNKNKTCLFTIRIIYNMAMVFHAIHHNFASIIK